MKQKQMGMECVARMYFFAVVYFALSLPLSKGDSGPKGIKGYPGIPGLPVSIQTVSLFIFYFMPTMQDVF